MKRILKLLAEQYDVAAVFKNPPGLIDKAGDEDVSSFRHFVALVRAVPAFMDISGAEHEFTPTVVNL